MEVEILRHASELSARVIGDVDPARLVTMLRELLGGALDNDRLIADEQTSAHGRSIWAAGLSEGNTPSAHAAKRRTASRAHRRRTACSGTPRRCSDRPRGVD